jgi:DNA modification methylase
MQGEEVNIKPGKLPKDYHCKCDFCQKYLGELIRPDGTNYSRLERRKYYGKLESKMSGGGHIARTPLHVARWAIQTYSKFGDWVLDPTMGAGTTAVEALTNGRNVVGMEIEFVKVIEDNLRALPKSSSVAFIHNGDARKIKSVLKNVPKKFSLVVNNPPYSGDESQKGMKSKNPDVGSYRYDKGKANLAFLKEGDEYWGTMENIYRDCIQRLKPGGYFVIGVKDMMRNKKPFLLHKRFCELLSYMGLKYKGMALLRHYPTTLFINTYQKFYPEVKKIPLYQTINIFQKG